MADEEERKGRLPSSTARSAEVEAFLAKVKAMPSARPASLKAMPSPTMPAPMIATRGRLAIEGPAIAGKDETRALNAAPFAGMTQTGSTGVISAAHLRGTPGL